MPITSSAKKAMRQAKARTQRRKPYKSRLKSEMKKFVTLAKTDTESAAKLLPTAYSVIDTAAKKHVIHKNNAARKKAGLAKMLTKTVTPTTTAAAPKAAKKATTKSKK